MVLKDLVDRTIYLKNKGIKEEFSGKEFFDLSEDKRIEMGLRSLEKRN